MPSIAACRCLCPSKLLRASFQHHTTGRQHRARERPARCSAGPCARHRPLRRDAHVVNAVARRQLSPLSSMLSRFTLLDLQREIAARETASVATAAEMREPAEQQRRSRKWRGRRKRGKVANLPYHKITMSNQAFELYYCTQHGLTDEDSEAFLAALRRDLPQCIRQRSYHTLSDACLSLVQQAGAPVSVMPWAPDSFLYRVSSHDIRRDPQLRALKAALVTACATGAIQRCEEVSLIPPLCLGLGHGERVLDMCAAPGTKASLAADLLLAPGCMGSSAMEGGALWCNDLDFSSAGLLAGRVAAGVPTPHLLVSYSDAARLPLAGGTFDKVICDVPCSGDGAIRKAPNKWSKWKPIDGISHHKAQLQLLRRALYLTRPGGLVVFSTCSMNPMENEAVVCAALRLAQGAVSVEAPPVLLGLQWAPGLATWRVPDTAQWGALLPTDPEQQHEDRGRDTCIDSTRSAENGYAIDARLWLEESTPATASLFPPSSSEQGAAHLRVQLQRCMRILPHLQDSSGFFVACLRVAETGYPEGCAIPPPPSTPSHQKRAWIFEVQR